MSDLNTRPKDYESRIIGLQYTLMDINLVKIVDFIDFNSNDVQLNPGASAQILAKFWQRFKQKNARKKYQDIGQSHQ